ncbi:MAG: hypothetical protein N4Q32_00110 [Neisseriaceae bacterium]|nr:hypothetical protein [Neisseriaceae bacterium]
MPIILYLPVNMATDIITRPFIDNQKVIAEEKIIEEKEKKQREIIQKEKEKEYKKHWKIINESLIAKEKLQPHISRELYQSQMNDPKNYDENKKKIRQKYAKIEEKYDAKIQAENERHEKANEDIEKKYTSSTVIPQKSALSAKMNLTSNVNLILLILTYAYLFFAIRQQKIYFNEKGVYAQLGLFPWTKGYIFFKWNDIERVGFTQSPLGFLFASSDVHIIRRYSGESATIKRIFKGKQFSGEASEYLYNNF